MNKTEVNEIFNLDDEENVPKGFKIKNSNKMHLGGNCKKVYALFKLKNILTIDEIIMGLYRINELQTTRVEICQVCCRLVKRGWIERIERGLYKFVAK